MIERNLTKKIELYLADFPAVALLGPRQVGKTTLAKYIVPKLEKPSIYLDLERPSQLEPLMKNPEAFLEQHKDKCLIIDEVQRYPALFPILRPMIDEYRFPGRFLLLGSASPTLLKESSESLAGRIMYTELCPLGLVEVGGHARQRDLWLNGGFPEPFSKKSASKRENWYASFLRTYFEKDLKMLGLNLNAHILSRTFTMMGYMQGGLCNLSQLSNSLATDRRTIERILEFFTSSYMLRRLSPFSLNVKKRLVKSPKYYIRDSGLLHHTLGIHTWQELFENPILGSSWEGFVVEQVMSLGLNLLPYFYRTQAGAECDLVLVQGNQAVVCIEAKMSNTPKMTKSLLSSLEDLKTEKNFIVTPSTEHPYPLKEGTTACNLTWLLNFLQENFS